MQDPQFPFKVEVALSTSYLPKLMKMTSNRTVSFLVWAQSTEATILIFPELY
jgi:hypothetical protein